MFSLAGAKVCGNDRDEEATGWDSTWDSVLVNSDGDVS